ncbi:hypothetical protein IJ076_00790 [Candidatus Saccharibacteria bacterium]|nr:hypothetical protein [Candidatus Saccharibacteria bacterium]
MPQTKKKNSTKTAKKTTVSSRTHKKASSRTACKAKGVSPTEKWHVYIVTALSMVATILLCTDIAMMVA